MADNVGSDLEAFVRFAEGAIGSQDAELTPEQCLALFRANHPTPSELLDGVAAVEEALDAMQDGDAGQPLEAFDRKFRQRNNLSNDG